MLTIPLPRGMLALPLSMLMRAEYMPERQTSSCSILMRLLVSSCQSMQAALHPLIAEAGMPRPVSPIQERADEQGMPDAPGW